MNKRYAALSARIAEHFAGALIPVDSGCEDLSYTVAKSDLLTVCKALRDDTEFAFDMLIDICGVDYLSYGQSEWQTDSASETGFSRGVNRAVIVADSDTVYPPERFCVVYHLLSVSKNHRLRLKLYTGPDNPPAVPSVIDIWASANWYEREAFDLFGIVFAGHPDLRRLLTDYGFIGHPFRKDFPLMGNVEVKYDPEQQRVVYQPVSIEARTLVPKVIRDDNRFADDGSKGASDE